MPESLNKFPGGKQEMHEERLQQIVVAKRSVTEVAYGYDPSTDGVLMIQGAEIEQMARELLALLERNRRMSRAVLSGNLAAVNREYRKQWMHHGERT